MDVRIRGIVIDSVCGPTARRSRRRARWRHDCMPRQRMNRALLLVPLGAALLALAHPQPAQACGGFFCNRPPPDGTLPIAQAAENVLFVLDRDPVSGANTVEAHIQILYTGPASEFSWIVPVTSVPTVTVGSDILFDRIEPPTRPSFQVTYQMEGNCQSVRRGRRVWQRRRRRRRLDGLRRCRRRGHGRGGCALARQRRAVRIRRRPIGGRRHAAHLADDQQLLRLAGGGRAGRRIRRRAVLVRGPAAAGRPGHVGHPPDRPAHDRERSVPAPEADRDRGHAGSAHQRVGARERARGPDQLRRGLRSTRPGSTGSTSAATTISS